MGQARKEIDAKWRGPEALAGPGRKSTFTARSLDDTPNSSHSLPLYGTVRVEPDVYCGLCGHLITKHSTGTCLGDRLCFCKRVFHE